MDVNLDDICIIRIKLNNDEIAELIAGERILFDIDQALQIEIYHVPDLKYPPRKQYLNGDGPDEH